MTFTRSKERALLFYVALLLLAGTIFIYFQRPESDLRVIINGITIAVTFFVAHFSLVYIK